MKSHTAPTKKSVRIGSKVAWTIMLLIATFPVLVSTSYLTLSPEKFSFSQQKLVYAAHLTMLMMHILASMLAILIGPFQFLDGLRKGRWVKIHRWLGRAYLICVLFGGLGGLYMAQFSFGGMVTHVGFAALAILWLLSGTLAYKHIRNKKVELHREWMIRNYALTFAGVMLRVWLPIAVISGFDFTASYLVIAWLCWVPNLLVAEWLILRRRGQVRQLTEARAQRILSRRQEIV